jgi:hypothetical protein
MNTKSLVLSFTLVLGYFFSNAQGLKLSDKPEEFLADAKNFLVLSNNPQADAISLNFEKLWNSDKLTDAQKSKLASVSNFMFKKGYKPPQFVGLFDAIILGVNNALIPQTLLDRNTP